jgi:Domain of unknown function (DUF4388)
MAVEGSLDLFSLPEILQMISQQCKTGILTVQGQQDIVAVSFLNGRIVAADSLAHTVEEGLSQVLVSERMLTASDFARATAENQAAGSRLLDLLVERRYLTRPQLLAALRTQTVRLLESLLRWQEGDFKFYGGDEVSYEDGFEPISVEDLLLRMLAELSATPPRPPAAAVPGADGETTPKLRAAPPRPAAIAEATPRWPAPVPAEAAAAPPAGAGGAGGPGAAAGPAAPGAPGGPRRLVADPPTGAGRAAPTPGPSGGGTSPRWTGSRELESGGLHLAGVPELPELALPLPEAAAGSPARVSQADPLVPQRAATVDPGPPARPTPAAAQVPWPAAVMAPRPGTGAPPSRPRLSGPPSAKPAGSPPAAAASALPARVRAGAIVPPDAPPLPRKFRQMQVERAEVPRLPRLISAALALGLTVALVLVARQVPETLLLPFPWEQSERNAFERNQREALFDKLDIAAKTAFLRDGRFPDQLSQLRDAGLLSPVDLRDPGGEPLLYTAREDSYTLQATEGGKALADAEASESITGNFLLDPNLVQSGTNSSQPIVLLD